MPSLLAPDRGQPMAAWRALRRRGYLLSAWPWRGLAFTALGMVLWLLFVLPISLVVAPIGAAAGVLADGDPLAAAALLVLGGGLGFVLLPLLASPLIACDRARAPLIDVRPLPPAARAPHEPGAWLRDRYATGQRWRHAAYVVVAMVLQALAFALASTLGITAAAMLASPVLVAAGETVDVGPWEVTGAVQALPLAVLGLLLVVLLAYGWTAAAAVQVALLRWALGGERAAHLAAELREVDRSRARLVDGFDAERRRIERDLHDGAQQRLVTLAMNLGMSRLEVAAALGADHPAALGVAAAHEQSKTLMDELRRFVRGIHPQVLTDVGLVAALDQLCSTMPLPVALESTLTARPPGHVETTAYFTISEALTNVVRHSCARRARIGLALVDHDLVAEVYDDGAGGADPALGSGLTGMADRLATVGGALALSSPPGGPTVVHVRIPVGPSHG